MYSDFKWTEISQIRNSIQRAYEPLQIYFFVELAGYIEGRSFLDIGANVGSYSLAMAKLQCIKSVNAFEPMPTLYKELIQNVQLNNLADNVTPCQIALSDRSGTARFGVISSYSGANGIVDTLAGGDKKLDSQISVGVESLDLFFEKVSLPDGPCFIKIDVEGHERAVLVGASEFLHRDCILQVEVLSGEQRPDNVDALLAEYGYSCFWAIGDDRYYAKPDRCPTAEELLLILSRAHQSMIDDFRRTEISGVGTGGAGITRRLGPVQVSLLDPLAGWLRRIAGR